MLEDVSCQKSFGVKAMTLTATPFLVAAKNFPLPPPPRGQHRPPPQLTCRLWAQLPSKYKPPIMDAISLTETVALPCIELKILALRTTTWVTQTAMTLTQRKCARIKNRPQISCLGICKFIYFNIFLYLFQISIFTWNVPNVLTSEFWQQNMITFLGEYLSLK